MKSLLPTACLLLSMLLILSCTAKELPTTISIDQQNILLLCSHETTSTDLEKASELIDRIHNMKLDYQASVFDEEGQIRELKLKLFYQDQKLASTSAQLLNLQFRYYGIQLTREGEEITGLKAGSFE